MKIIAIPFITLSLIGCGGDKNSNVTPEENIIVYISKGNTQCNDDGLSADDSSQVLVNAGIDVIETFCGVTTGLSVAAVCGGVTGDILAHEIREVNLSRAKELGYKAIETLVDAEKMIGYKINKCEDI